MKRTLKSLLVEARDYTRQFAGRCCECNWFGAGFHVGVQADVLEDAEKTAEKALAEFSKAQASKSDGGVNITPVEAARITRLLGEISR